MEMLQFLEADKEQLRNGLMKAGTPEQAQTVLEKEFDKLLLQYNEECAEERVRNEARHMTQTAKMMIPLISAAGETRIWSKNAGGTGAGSKSLTKRSIACIAGGALFLVAAIVSMALSAGASLTASALLGAIPAAILGGALLFWGGRLSLELKTDGQDAKRGEETYQVEIRVDPDRVWSGLRATVLSIDKGLQEARESVNYERDRISESEGGGLTDEEAELFSGLLESAYSLKEEAADDSAILETISQIRYYLHRKQVETVDYGGGKREWFELLPGRQDMTIRPALVRNGVLVRKGLAVSAQ